MMKRVTAWFSMISFFLLLCAGCAVGGRADGLVLRVNPFPDYGQTMITCTETESGEYALFLPANADCNALYVEYDGSVLRCEGERLPNGEVTDLFSSTGEYALTRGGNSYHLLVLQSENLPSIYISSEQDLNWLHQSRDNKSPGEIVIVDDGAVVTQTSLRYIKGRGNSTWNLEENRPGCDKRPYNIKLNEEMSLLKMAPSKKWRLLANALDRYYVNNEIGLQLARKIGVSAALDCRPVDLYVNGDYRGNYLLTEAIEPDAEHVPVNDTQSLNEAANANASLDLYDWQTTQDADNRVIAQWRRLPQTPDEVEWAFIVELIDRNEWNEQFSFFRTIKNNWYEIKNPEDSSEKQVAFVSEVFNRAEKALYSIDGYDDNGDYYGEMVDIESLVRTWLVQELMTNPMSCNESTFYYLPQGSKKIISGPVWDFDQTGGTSGPDWQVCSSNFGVNWFSAAFRHVDFRSAAARCWADFCSSFSSDEMRQWIDGLCRNIACSVVMDKYRWGPHGSSPEATAEAYLRLGANIAQGLSLRAERLKEALSDNNALLWFEFSEEDFFLFPDFVSRGDTVTIPYGDPELAKVADDFSPYAEYLFGNEAFLCFSEHADGSGARYYPGDTICLTEAETTLYAVYTDGTH